MIPTPISTARALSTDGVAERGATWPAVKARWKELGLDKPKR